MSFTDGYQRLLGAPKIHPVNREPTFQACRRGPRGGPAKGKIAAGPGEVPSKEPSRHFPRLINTSEPVHSFTFNMDDDKDPFLIQTILMHPGTYVATIGVIFPV